MVRIGGVICCCVEMGDWVWSRGGCWLGVGMVGSGWLEDGVVEVGGVGWFGAVL